VNVYVYYAFVVSLSCAVAGTPLNWIVPMAGSVGVAVGVRVDVRVEVAVKSG